MTTERPTSKPAILAVAVAMARKKGLFEFARVDVAEEAKIAESTVSYHFGTMDDLRKAIVQHAVAHEILSILADARASRVPLGVPMSEELRDKVAAYITR